MKLPLSPLPTVSVILSTYNQPDWLEKVLWGYQNQSFREFEIVIADDGSGMDTLAVIDRFQQQTHLQLVHVWHEDRGFQKSQILNKAILAASGEYLIFSDGDCIPRHDFVEVHIREARPGFFLSGGYFMLPKALSKLISKDHIFSGQAFDARWLYENGLPSTYKTLKLTAQGWQQALLNGLTPTKATWNGHNASGWKEDILSVNGFNEDMQYGGQDRELGERLMNKGLRGRQIRYSAVCLHLDHARGYKTPESITKNRLIRAETRLKRKVWTEAGLIRKEGVLV
jgi:glycosyltransferase involved in cell wall biosynthesis